MPIGEIISQPVANSISAAYRPVVVRVSATRTDANPRPPVVYCDIYFNDVYYKSLPKTAYAKLNGGNTEWQFDIQDAAQEYLRKFIAANGESSIVEAPLLVAKAVCKFRSSGYDANGFILAEGVAPIQGFGDDDPVPGNGTSTNEFYVVNATLQHHDNQDLSAHLNSFKKRTWAATTWPLTHRPDHYQLCRDDSDSFPILHGGNPLICLVLNYKFIGQNTFHQLTKCDVGGGGCPAISNVIPDVEDNGNGTETFTFTFDAFAGIVTSLTIQYRISGSTDAWTSEAGSPASPRAITLPLGFYDFRFISSGDCVAQISEEVDGIGISSEGCVAVGISGSPDLPNAQDAIVYNYSFSLTGSAPFVLSSVVKPAWMTIDITGSTVNFTGTPGSGDLGSDIPVSFDVKNCSDTNTVSFADTLNVTASSAKFTATTFVSGNALNEVEIANLIGIPGSTITVRLTAYVNNNGGVLQVNGVTAALGDTWNFVVDGTGHASFDVEIFGIVIPNPSAIFGRFTITAVDTGTIGSPNQYQISKAFS